MYVTPFEDEADSLQTSGSMNALCWKCLSGAGCGNLYKRCEAHEENVMRRAYPLHRCSQTAASYKIVRLCLQLGQELSVLWVVKN
jgi:hypothetical protein